MAEPYRFGQFTLSRTDGRLCANGVPIPLGRTDLHLLIALLEKAGSVVLKDDLISAVWGRALVGDNVLYVHINALRRILGRDLIINEQSRGYRFVVPSEPMGPSASGDLPCTTNLPALWTNNTNSGPTRLIGRSEQLEIVSRLLGQARLVTLTGPGGVGKTRLALQAGYDASSFFPDGVWLVELAALKDENFLPSAIASVLGLQIGSNARPIHSLTRYLAHKSLLIILDNCEHLIAPSARLSEFIMESSAFVKILATSREALSCGGEQVFDVPPLDVPPEGSRVDRIGRQMHGVELFIERATAADANFRVEDHELPVVAKICRRVDGLPLAIEIVAGWAGILGLEVLGAQLDSYIDRWLHARTTAPSRHMTLRATLEWSHDLLSPVEQTVLRRVAIFANGFDLNAAEEVISDEIIPRAQVVEHLASLVRKSMISIRPRSQPRNYRLLETTRVFALGKFTPEEERKIRQRHADYVLHVLQRALREWETTSDTIWQQRYRPILDDVRSAIDRSIIAESDDCIALAGASWPLWQEFALPLEGRQRIAAALTMLRPLTSPELEAQLRFGFGMLSKNSAAVKAAVAELVRAEKLYRSLGDIFHLANTLIQLTFTYLVLDRFAEAESFIAEALALLEGQNCPRTLANAYATKLCIEARLGRFESAQTIGQRAIEQCAIIGASRVALTVSANLVEIILDSGDIEGAVSAGRNVSMRLRDTTHSDLRGFVLGVLAAALTVQGNLHQALLTAREAAPILRDQALLFWLFDHLALRLALAGRLNDAALLVGYSEAVHTENEYPRWPMGLRAVARVHAILSKDLPSDEICRLARLGSRLSEEQALSIGLSP